MRTASERQDVRAVVAVSPFVGWDEIDRIPDIQAPTLFLQGTGNKKNDMKAAKKNVKLVLWGL
ncbi:hypothetical protein KZ483_20830 [Paenibacillus sp. sptzw28]|uniref:hypothetical protein n=1 Tax=Paenibacillus sp. sptzw28 TaxID=715179 RepID=UPI001C6EB33A|nr:hypothetical protein [Paenibacillus sp. sptzw28]QYR20256.1 hypothetical protein KZ483_20830 [Paenibacillus sp. sptzw28]